MDRRLLSSDFEAALLHPTLVYGSGSLIWTDFFLRALSGGGLVLPEPAGLAALVHAEDVAHAAALAAAAEGLARERFIVSAPPVPWEDYLSGLAALVAGPAGGRGLIREPLSALTARLGPEGPPGSGDGPSVAARVSAGLRAVLGTARFEAVLDRVRALSGPKGPAYPDRFQLGLFTARPQLSADLAAARLGFSPRLSLQQGLEEIRQQLGR
jgi:nucleoside-diphosphate-sugar epimerase